MKTIDISVIVPIYNVEEYLRECLDSILRQGEVSLEVVMIDDGSTDNSGTIADEYVAKYENFYCYHIQNGGLGHARNYGVERSHGKYIAFVDSDDIVVDGTYEKMFKAAERNGSELTICNAVRFNSSKKWGSYLHRMAFKDFEVVSHITKNHNLIYDPVAWNKLILRSFYKKHNFRFPENILYEDVPVTIPMHVYCNHVTMLSHVGYLWRFRDGGAKSISQNTEKLENLIDKIKILKLLDEFFEKSVSNEELKLKNKIKSLEHDLELFSDQIDVVSEEQGYKIFDYINKYIKSIDSSVFLKLPIIDQQKYKLIKEKNLQGYKDLLAFQRKKYEIAPVKEEDGKLIVSLPDKLFTVKERNILPEFSSRLPRYYIDRVSRIKDGFQIYGHVYLRRFNLVKENEQSVRAFLFDENQNLKIEVEVTPVSVPFLTKKFGLVIDKESGEESLYNYNGSGFIVEIKNSLLSSKGIEEGIYRIQVHYKNRFFNGTFVLGGIDSSVKKTCNALSVIDSGLNVRINFNYLNEISFEISKPDVFIDKIYNEGDLIYCVLKEKAEKFRARLKEEYILFEKKNDSEFFSDLHQFNKNHEDIYILEAQISGKWINIIDEKRQAYTCSNENHLTIYSSFRTNVARLHVMEHATLVKSWKKEGQKLIIETYTLGNEKNFNEVKKAQIYIEDNLLNTRNILAESFCKNIDSHIICRFEIDFKDDKVTKNLYARTSDIHINYLFDDNVISENCVYHTGNLSFNISVGTLGVFCYRSMLTSLKIQLEQIRPKGEETQLNRDKLIFVNYPKYRNEKIKQRLILFESDWGRRYSCNPQALYEYIDKNYPQYECVWSFNDERTPIKGRAKRVRRGSLKYYYYLATAKYLINNVNFPDDYIKRPGQIEIQTMHGTPLKSFGLDIPNEFQTEISREKFLLRNSRWDYLIVQGKFMEEKAYPCFHFQKSILKSGYPRTDRLFNKNSVEISNIKRILGIPENKKIILYAPTWRVKNKFDMHLNLDLMRDNLSDEYIILIRIHYFSLKGYKIPEDRDFIFNVNNYSYVDNLYLISDILITDYSSLMFDFALLGKPMLFFTYDLEEYRDNLRGLYVDFEKESPGPLLFTTEEVIDAIKNIDDVIESYKQRILNFHDKFLTYENKNSCEKVIKEVFKPNLFLNFLARFRGNRN